MSSPYKQSPHHCKKQIPPQRRKPFFEKMFEKRVSFKKERATLSGNSFLLAEGNSNSEYVGNGLDWLPLRGELDFCEAKRLRGRYPNRPTALSVTCGDSSPKGRAKLPLFHSNTIMPKHQSLVHLVIQIPVSEMRRSPLL